MNTSPGGACLTSGNGTSIGKTDINFQVKSNDRDGNLNQLQIEIWDAASGTDIHNEWITANADQTVNRTVPRSKFTWGRKYFWLARAVDWDGFGAAGSGPLDARPAGAPSPWTTSLRPVRP